MSTNKLQIPKASGQILLFSGIYLFFISLIIGPFLNFSAFSSVHTTTKLLLVTSSAIIGILQLLFYVPRISKSFVKSLSPNIFKILGIISISLMLSTIFSTSFKTAVFGMFTAWESNIMIYFVYIVLFFAWYVHFHLARHLKIDSLLFNTLLSLLLITTISFGLGEYYLWKPSTGYISLSVVRLSLGFRNPLFAGYFVGMLWSFQFIRTFAILIDRNRSRQILLSISSLMLTAGITHILLLTYTRSAWISSLISISVMFFLFVLIQMKRKQRFTKRFIVGAITIAMVITPQIYALRKSITKRSSDILVESKNTLTTIANSIGARQKPEKALSFYQEVNNYTSTDIRLMEWKWGIRTWTATPRNFLIGIGSDNMYFDMPKYRDPIFNTLPTDSSTKPFYIRNMFITMLVEHGIISTIATFMLLIIVGKSLLSYLLISRRPSQQIEQIILPLTLIISWFAQGLFYYPTHITTVLMIFALSFTLAKITDFSKISLRAPSTTEKTILFVIAILLSGWLFLIIKTETILAIYKIRPLPEEATEMEKNAKIPLNNNVLQRYLAYYYPSRNSSQQYLLNMIDSADPDDLRIAGDALYTFARNERNPQALERSIIAIENLIKIDNSLPSTWDARGLRYLYKGDFKTANQSFYKALELKNDYWYAYMHLGEVARQQCNPEKAIRFYEQAELFIPSAQVEMSEARQEIEVPKKECRDK